MFNFLKNLFGGGGPALTADQVRNATLIDVRSPGEFARGHAPNTVNVPLGEIDRAVPQLRKAGKPVVACCASGNRSGMAVKKLRAAGLEAHNAGSWQQLRRLTE